MPRSGDGVSRRSRRGSECMLATGVFAVLPTTTIYLESCINLVALDISSAGEHDIMLCSRYAGVDTPGDLMRVDQSLSHVVNWIGNFRLEI
jgi:hypothetical protein